MQIYLMPFIKGFLAIGALFVSSFAWSSSNLPDLNHRKNIIEIELVAAVTTSTYVNGVETEVWSYNNIVPGPTIKGKVGQTLIVHFYNELPEPTTVHWHGLEVPANMDGSNISQGMVPSGGYFRYKFKLTRAGTYWYHPHANSNEQVERGLQGALIVTDDDDKRVHIKKHDEKVLVLDDILLDENGQVAEFAADLSSSVDPVTRAAELFNSRQGNLLLVNGKQQETIKVVSGKPIRLRLVNTANGRFMRLSSGDQKMYQIGTDGGLLNDIRTINPVTMIHNHHTGEMTSNPSLDQGLLLTPAERADVVIVPNGNPGEVKYIRWHDTPSGQHNTFLNADGSIGFGHAHNDGGRPPANIVSLEFVHGKKGKGWHPTLPLRKHPIQPIKVTHDTQPLIVPFGHGAPMQNGNVMFINAVKQSDAMYAALENLMAAADDESIVGPVPGMVMPPMFQPIPFGMLNPEDALHANVGETRIWYLINFTGGDHDFHSHGFFFQPLETIQVNLDGVSANDRVRRSPMELVTKDTVHMPRRAGAGGRSWTIVKAAVRFDDSDLPQHLQRSAEQLVASGKSPTDDTSGGWLAHCHFLEHAGNGMMNFLNLEIQ